MISYPEALALIQRVATPLPATMLPVTAAVGAVAAVDIVSPQAVPPFANSAMDGFALAHQQTATASPQTPLRLPVSGSVAAGEAPQAGAAGAATEIMTGARVPAACDAVVPVENVQVENVDGRPVAITLTQPVPAHDNVRFAGEDFSVGQRVLAAGTRIGAAQVMALCATGVAAVSVRRQPTVGLIATGLELSDNYGAPLGDNAIYNSNTPYLAAMLAAAGVPHAYLGRVADEAEHFAALLRQRRDCAVLVSTGAVSKGRRDFIPDVLREAGAEIFFHRVAIKPGKPVLFARLPDGRFYFGLPGNPIAAAVGLRFFVAPLLRGLLGLPAEAPQAARLQEAWRGKGGLTQFLKARAAVDGEGQRWIAPLPGQESFKISPLLAMNAWLVIAAEHQEAAAGTVQASYVTALWSAL